MKIKVKDLATVVMIAILAHNIRLASAPFFSHAPSVTVATPIKPLALGYPEVNFPLQNAKYIKSLSFLFCNQHHWCFSTSLVFLFEVLNLKEYNIT